MNKFIYSLEIIKMKNCLYLLTFFFIANIFAQNSLVINFKSEEDSF